MLNLLKSLTSLKTDQWDSQSTACKVGTALDNK